MSQRRRAERVLYSRMRRDFLKTHRFCIVSILLSRRESGVVLRYATQVHHQRGRAGNLYLDTNWWLPVSHWGHVWIGSNVERARALGLLAPLGHYNKPAVRSTPLVDDLQLIA